MSPALSQFRDLLAQLFQTSDSDLNFGIYRVLNQERHHIDTFLNERLEGIVKDALNSADDSQRASLQSELDALAKSAADLGMNPEDSPKWKQKKTELDALQTSLALETEVYNGLTDFFGRYYDNGDFLSKPRYKRDVYALPYNGEEVKLHWANRDQYYIKSARVLEEFSFGLNGKNICFAIAPTENGDGDNNKENRQFVLATDSHGAPLVNDQNGVTTVQFHFKKPVKIGDSKDVLAVDAAPLLAQVPELSFATEAELQTKLRSWTRRKDWDFFVHKDLETFLKRELDFYLKNEVVQLDGLFRGDADAWGKTTLAKARAMHGLGARLIEFLAQLENLCKRLWEKQKWVTQSRIVIPWAKVPETLRAEVLGNKAQIAEWMALYGVEGEAVSTENPVVWTNPPSAQWADNHQDISVDSAHFDATWLHRLWSELSREHNLDELWQGILFNADNFAALNLMGARFKEAVKCIYIDPPYNTGGDGFLYKDSYQHSSWLSMMEDRLELARELMSDDAAIFVSIDDDEQARLKTLLENVFGDENFVANIIWQKKYAPANDAKYLSDDHDFVLCAMKGNWKPARLARTEEQDRSYTNPDNDERGRWKADNYVTNKTATERPNTYYSIEQPNTGEDIWPSKRAVWRYSKEQHAKNVAENRVWWGVKGDNKVPAFKRFLSEVGGIVPRTIWGYSEVGHTQSALKELREMFEEENTSFTSPKPVPLIERVLAVNPSDLILDYFAGSGTTGHAVMNLNRADAGNRRFVLCEMGRYFDSVLLPRLKKAAFALKWKDGKPADFSHRGGVGACLWSYQLESYEDALEHLAAGIPDKDEQIAFEGDDEFTVRYALSMNARDGVLPLCDELFASPFGMQMRIGGEGVDKAEARALDGVATFNWLLGLRVHKMWWIEPEAQPTPNSSTSPKSARLACVCGLTPTGRAVAVIWRQLAGVEFEAADAALLAFWREDEILNSWRQSHEVETVYVNGDSTAWRTATSSEKWTAEPLENTFRDLMFASTGQTEAL